ncbi:MAG: NifB/NifX family molybdenum-iron cluster-binding protein [Desulfobacteraceae bacterium]|jgi:predicted Fe-Mo cluster-binding NifX family protein
MTRIAIPIFKSRVSPVLDTCTRILVVDIEEKREIERREIYQEEFSLSERVNTLKKAHVATVICGGISDVLHNMFNSENISVITGIAGEAEEVVAAFMAHRLNEPRFYMPGYKKRG